MISEDPQAANVEEDRQEGAEGVEEETIMETCAIKVKRMKTTRHYCRVKGCMAALSLYYNWRYRICQEHRKAPSVEIDGVSQRFCQLCGKFQPVAEFSGSKVSCEDALRLHNLRRRMNARRRRGSDGVDSDGDKELKRTRKRRTTETTRTYTPTSSDSHHDPPSDQTKAPSGFGPVQPMPRRLPTLGSNPLSNSRFAPPAPQSYHQQAQPPSYMSSLQLQQPSMNAGGFDAYQAPANQGGFKPWGQPAMPSAPLASAAMDANAIAAIKELLAASSMMNHNNTSLSALTAQVQDFAAPPAMAPLNLVRSVPVPAQPAAAPKAEEAGPGALIAQTDNITSTVEVKTEAAAQATVKEQRSAADILRFAADLIEMGQQNGSNALGDLMGMLAGVLQSAQ